MTGGGASRCGQRIDSGMDSEYSWSVGIQFPQAAEHRPTPAVLKELEPSCRALLVDRATFDDRYLIALGSLLPDGHPLRQVPGAALDLLDVLMRAAVSGDSPERVEAECQECGARCATVGLPDDTFPAIGRAASRAAREVVGESWSSALSSGWAALHVWVVEHLTAGASRGRSRAHVWQPFPEPDLSKPQPGQSWGEGEGEAFGPSVASHSASAAAEWALLEQAARTAAPDRSAGPVTDPEQPEAPEERPAQWRTFGSGTSWSI